MKTQEQKNLEYAALQWCRSWIKPRHLSVLSPFYISSEVRHRFMTDFTGDADTAEEILQVLGYIDKHGWLTKEIPEFPEG